MEEWKVTNTSEKSTASTRPIGVTTAAALQIARKSISMEVMDENQEVAEKCFNQLRGCLWGLGIDTASKAMLLGSLKFIQNYLHQLEEGALESASTVTSDTTRTVPGPSGEDAPAA